MFHEDLLAAAIKQQVQRTISDSSNCKSKGHVFT